MDTTGSRSAFDAEEILHLAIEAARRGDHGSALGYLKQGAAGFPEDARIAYMLGAEHAQIGMYDRAETEMVRAIELDPALHMARFQLGLLQLTGGRPSEASATWSEFDQLPQEHALRLFKAGLEAMAEDRFAEAREHLEAGLKANDFSPELSRDMENLLGRLPTDDGEGSAESTSTPVGHVWLNAYRSPEEGER